MGARTETFGREKPVVLVVDDNLMFLDLFRTALSRKYEVHLAHDGDQGIEKATELRPDAIVMDLMMPRVSGQEAIANIQARPEMRGIPIVILSALPETRSRREGAGSGGNVTRYLEKTTALPKVVEEIGRAVYLGQLYRETQNLRAEIFRRQNAA